MQQSELERLPKSVQLCLQRANAVGAPLTSTFSVDFGGEMKIKLAGLITVAEASGPIMNKSETVTFFNDMCLIAPETLIDDNGDKDTCSRTVSTPVSNYSVLNGRRLPTVGEASRDLPSGPATYARFIVNRR